MARPFTDPVTRFWSKVDVHGPVHPTLGTPCWVWRCGRVTTGYGLFKVGGHPGTTYLAHRFAWENVCGQIPNGLFVLHACDNPSCVRPDHLFLGTHADNSADMVRKGRQAKISRPAPWAAGRNHWSSRQPNSVLRGSVNPASKLTEQDVMTIRSIYTAGDTSQQMLADRYGVSQVAISLVVRREKWKHVA